MTNKKIIIDDIDVNALCSDEIACMNRYEVARLFVKTVERLVAKEQENEELRQYHNKCCEENAKKMEEWLEKYNQVSRDFYNGDFCNTEKCQQLAHLKEENDRLRKRIVTIFDCLIKANRDVIVDTLWVDKITTLWDYIAQTLGIEGDQNQIEEQVEMLYSEGE